MSPMQAAQPMPGGLAARISIIAEAGAVLVAPILAVLVFRLSIVNQDGFWDPWLYTGLARDLDLIWRAVGPNYFDVRFSVILPMRFAVAMFGDIGGYVAIHYVAFLILAAPLYVLIRRRLGRSSALVVLVFLISTPIVPRFILWDYTNFLVIPYFVAAIAFWHLGDDRPAINSMLSGFFAVGAVAAHAFVSAGLAIFFLTELVAALLLQRNKFGVLLQKCLWAAAGGALCALAGWLGYIAILGWFPPRALIEVTLATVGDVIHRADQFAIPFRDWVMRNYDVYMPFVLAFAAIARFGINLDNTARRFVWFAFAYVCFYLFWEFGRTGIIFELFYYFAYLFPAIVLLLAFILSTAKGSHGFHLSFSVALVVVALLFAWRLGPLHDWLSAAVNSTSATVWLIVGSAIAVMLFVLWRSRPALASFAGVGLAIAVQCSVLANPDYGHLLGSASIGQQLPLYRAATDIIRTTRDHSAEGDWVLTWAPNADGNPFWNMQAVNYATLVRFPWVAGPATLSAEDLQRFADRRFRNVLILGTSDAEIDARLATLRASGIELVERERTSFSIGFARLVEMTARPPFVLKLTASQLPSQIGSVDGEARTAIAGNAPAGVLTFGPYAALAAGKYEVQIGYGPSEGGQSWDVVGIGPRQQPLNIAAGEFPATVQSDAVLKVPIELKTAVRGLEVRSKFSGSGRLTVRSLGVRVLD
jgi:hypothetical protein